MNYLLTNKAILLRLKTLHRVCSHGQILADLEQSTNVSFLDNHLYVVRRLESIVKKKKETLQLRRRLSKTTPESGLHLFLWHV